MSKRTESQNQLQTQMVGGPTQHGMLPVTAPIVKINIEDESELDRIVNGSATDVEGVDLLGREDMAIPRLTLVQAQSDVPDADQHLGAWFNSLTGEFRKPVNAVLLAVGLGRVAFPRNYSRDSEPLCGSDDAIEPRAEYIGRTVTDSKLQIDVTIPEVCAVCPLSQFGENSETPLCAKTYIYFMLDIDNGLPFIAQMARTATKTAKQINTIAKMVGRKRLIVLSSKKVSSDTGNYYEPVFTSGEPTPNEILALASTLTRDLGNMAVRMQRENRVHSNGDNGYSGGSTGGIDERNPDDELPF